jgi:hypothetical protein
VSYLPIVKDDKLKIHGTLSDVLKVAMRPPKKKAAPKAQKAAKKKVKKG